MKKYTIQSAFSTLNKILVVKDDVVYAEANLHLYSLYNPESRNPIGLVTKEVFEASIKKEEEDKQFPNGFYSWRDTFFELANYMTLVLATHPEHLDYESEVFDTQEAEGGAGLYDLAEEWADEFEELNKGRDWEDGDFYIEVEMYAKAKDLGEDYQEKLAEWQEKEIAADDRANNEPVTIYNADLEENDIKITKAQLRALQSAKLVHVHETALWFWKTDLEQINKIIKPN